MDHITKFGQSIFVNNWSLFVHCAITSVVFTLTFVSAGKIGMLLFGIALVNLNGNVDIANQNFRNQISTFPNCFIITFKNPSLLLNY